MHPIKHGVLRVVMPHRVPRGYWSFFCNVDKRGNDSFVPRVRFRRRIAKRRSEEAAVQTV